MMWSDANNFPGAIVILIFYLPQDEKNEIITTNMWITMVRDKYNNYFENVSNLYV